MTAALVGFFGVVLGLAVGFGYRFWSTRRDEMMAATIAATLIRDAARAVQEAHSTTASLVSVWEEERAALIRLITPADYEALSRNIDSARPPDSRLTAVCDRLTLLFWKEHQAFILTPLIKYLRRDNLSDKVSAIVTELR